VKNERKRGRVTMPRRCSQGVNEALTLPQ
jgi:hypothetical protein